MTKAEKHQLVEDLSRELASTDFFYITDSSGLDVEQVNNFRRMCFKNGLKYRVVKNTMIQKALETLDADFAPFEPILKGFSGVILSPESGSAPARVIKEFRKKHGSKTNPNPSLKGASINYDLFVGEENLEMLSTLKSKNELIGEIVGLLQSPAKNVLGALQSGGNTLAGLVKTLSEREN